MVRILIIAGVVLLGLGIAILLGELNVSERKDVLEVGEFRASVTQERAVPRWVGIVAVVGGAALIAGGLVRKR